MQLSILLYIIVLIIYVFTYLLSIYLDLINSLIAAAQDLLLVTFD